MSAGAEVNEGLTGAGRPTCKSADPRGHWEEVSAPCHLSLCTGLPAFLHDVVVGYLQRHPLRKRGKDYSTSEF